MTKKIFFTVLACTFFGTLSVLGSEAPPPVSPASDPDPVTRLGVLDVSAHYLSIFKAIAAPEAYAGRKVIVVGLYSRDGSRTMLYPTEELSKVLDTSSAVHVSDRMLGGERLPRSFEGKFIAMGGTLFYDAKEDRVALFDITFASVRFVKDGERR